MTITSKLHWLRVLVKSATLLCQRDGQQHRLQCLRQHFHKRSQGAAETACWPSVFIFDRPSLDRRECRWTESGRPFEANIACRSKEPWSSLRVPRMQDYVNYPEIPVFEDTLASPDSFHRRSLLRCSPFVRTALMPANEML